MLTTCIGCTSHTSILKVPRDPRFGWKLEDIVGLYMSPPEHTLVLVLVLRREAPGPGAGLHEAGATASVRARTDDDG